jgi:hypothetical protein
VDESGGLDNGIVRGADDVGVENALAGAVLANRTSIDRCGIGMGEQAVTHQLGDNRGNSSGVVIVLAEVIAGGLQVDQKRDVVANPLPVVVVERNIEVSGDGVEMNGNVRRSADGRVGHKAFSNASRVMMSLGRRSSRTICARSR